TEKFLDLVLIDSTPNPSVDYLARVRTWAKSQPFGLHRIRLKRFGADGESRNFATRDAAQQYGYRLAVELFVRSLSYDHLIFVHDDVPLMGLDLEWLVPTDTCYHRIASAWG